MAQTGTPTRGMRNQLLQATTARPALPLPRLSADISETPDGDAYVLEIPVPGVTTDQIVVEATADTVTVSTQPQPSGGEAGRTYLQREQQVVPMSRVFEFPVEIDPDTIKASLEHGILELVVPKAAATRPRVIKLG